MNKRTPAEEMAAWKVRVAELFTKEARCPACAKFKRLVAEQFPEGTTIVPVCDDHERIRANMALSGMKTWSRVVDLTRARRSGRVAP